MVLTCSHSVRLSKQKLSKQKVLLLHSWHTWQIRTR